MGFICLKETVQTVVTGPSRTHTGSIKAHSSILLCVSPKPSAHLPVDIDHGTYTCCRTPCGAWQPGRTHLNRGSAALRTSPASRRALPCGLDATGHHQPWRRWVASVRASAARASASLYSAMGDLTCRCQRRSRSTLHTIFI